MWEPALPWGPVSAAILKTLITGRKSHLLQAAHNLVFKMAVLSDPQGRSGPHPQLEADTESSFFVAWSASRFVY